MEYRFNIYKPIDKYGVYIGFPPTTLVFLFDSACYLKAKEPFLKFETVWRLGEECPHNLCRRCVLGSIRPARNGLEAVQRA